MDALTTADPAEQGRERLRALLGLDLAHDGGSMSEPIPQAPARGDSLEVLLRGDRDSVPAFLLRPDQSVATGAAVVLVAGHGRGIEDLVATDPADGGHAVRAERSLDALVEALA